MPQASGVMVVAELEPEGAELAPISAELLGIGRQLSDAAGQPLTAVLLGRGLDGAARALGELGADRVLVADDSALETVHDEVYLGVLSPLVEQESPDILLLGHTPDMRELAARLAFRLGTGLTTDCTRLRIEDGLLVMTKPVYGGSAIAELVVEEARPEMATIRPRAFEPATPDAGRQAEVQRVSAEIPTARARVVDTVKEVATSGPSLKAAKAVVSGGRGLGGPDNWHYVEELAGVLDAAVGATRAVTDAGWVPASHQVGLTGVTITPDLYVTVAVSGAVQHIAGCSGSRNIVAINKDPDANIFKHARFGVIGDYKQVVPAMTERIKELRG
jgi:electron transfer flavoprotein alpha subunit